ncbi:MAG: hypothetical protein IPG71_14380 [bacterium]|nr:hypothetical protein [bacterium]
MRLAWRQDRKALEEWLLMPAAYLDLANQITSRLAAVPNVGRVHHYQRNLNALETVKAEFFDHNLGRIAA